jgi:hypothetical protein
MIQFLSFWYAKSRSYTYVMYEIVPPLSDTHNLEDKHIVGVI